ncbi:MAG: hypothetical protein M1826_001749 [Phylliscum demangeonii]|nr:MAG: hypothetical protein M1826_001749 [Phylliscum demangeonii]
MASPGPKMSTAAEGGRRNPTSPRPLRRDYPADCPPFQAHWFYAVDFPKRKPPSSAPSASDKKPLPVPKKYVPFSAKDSRSVETGYETVVRQEDEKAASKHEVFPASSKVKNIQIHDAYENKVPDHGTSGSGSANSTRIPVNEDYLFDVNIQERELAPVYWLGPVYDVQGSTLRPCEENLASQLEEGYLNATPFRVASQARSASQPRPSSSRDSREAQNDRKLSGVISQYPSDDLDIQVKSDEREARSTSEDASKSPRQLQTHRLLGKYMNSMVTYQDAKTAWILTDDFLSRMSSTVYERFLGGGYLGGAKVVRGYTNPNEPKKSKDAKVDGDKKTDASVTTSTEARPASSSAGKPDDSGSEPTPGLDSKAPEPPKLAGVGPGLKARRQALERQMTNLVTSGKAEDPETQEEEARKREEEEIRDDYRDDEGEDQGREIEHLILVTHGIGQRLGLRMESVNFIHDVNVLRKTLKGVYDSSPDLLALNHEIDKLPKNCRLQVLPVCWRHLLDFPKHRARPTKQDGKPADLGPLEDVNRYPSLEEITIEGVPAVRNLITDLALDILLYQSAYREHIARIVQRECNRIYGLFLDRNPTFKGRVSLLGHSLGSAILFDLLCHQPDGPQQRTSAGSRLDVKAPKTDRSKQTTTNTGLDLHFDVDCFFCIGSPIGLFQMLKGRKIAARHHLQPLKSPFDPYDGQDPFLHAAYSSDPVHDETILGDLPITTSSPKCSQLYNVFHPTDPISYRLEPLISAAMSSLPPQLLPYTKKGIFGAPVGQGLSGIGARVGQSVSGLWTSFSAGIASSILNRSLGITGDDLKTGSPSSSRPQAEVSLSIGAGTNISSGKVIPTTPVLPNTAATEAGDEKKRKVGEEVASNSAGNERAPTLIDGELETLYAGFQKRRKSNEGDKDQALEESPSLQAMEERARILEVEEQKIKALNSNGRVDYSIQEKYPQFQQDEIFSLQDAFRKLDAEDRGYLDEATVIKAAQQSERQPYDVVRQALRAVEVDSSRRVELDDYVDLVARLRTSSITQKDASTGAGSKPAPPSAGSGHVSRGSVGGGGGGGGKIQMQGSSANVSHTINEDERTEFTRHINAVLAGDPDIGLRLPFPTDTFEMFDQCKDGLVLAKLINDSVPDTIDERVLNRVGKKLKQLNAFHMTENNNIVINSAKAIGCSVVNIGSGDIIEVREHLILGLIWQVIRRGLLGKIDIKLHPELYRLLEEDETLEQFLRLPPEKILLRWFNYHLKAAKWERRVANFSQDVKDGENYTILLNQLAPAQCSRAALQTRDLLQRAEQVLQNADALGCRKFLTPSSLVAGNPKLNLAFVAHLFNTHPGLDPISEEEKLQVDDFDAEGEREARVFTLWLNSLDVQPAVHSLFDDVRDGLVLLQAYDKVIPGSVSWRHVNKAPAGGELMRFKAVENTNYAVELGKQNRFSLVGIQGADITDGQRTLVLAMVWQLMRKDISETLAKLATQKGKREITDSDMVQWANAMAHKSSSASATASIRSFKDHSLANGLFLLAVLRAMKPAYVDDDLLTPGRTDDECYANAKLAISIARKLGATIWLVPEDIVQVRSRLVTTFIGEFLVGSLRLPGVVEEEEEE